jgi:hypothetical protein
MTPLHLAASIGSQECLALLFRYGAELDLVCQEEINGGGSGTALHFAVGGRKLEVVKNLVKAGVGIELHDVRGRSAFCLACENGWVEGAVWLIKETTCVVGVEDVVKGGGEVKMAVREARGREKGGAYEVKKKRGSNFFKNLMGK